MKLAVCSIIFFLLFLNLVCAVSPVTQVQQFANGYIIEDSPQEVLKQSRDYQYNFFVYNLSSGQLVGDTLVNCSFYIANSNGSVSMYQSVSYSADGHWGVRINKGNFTDTGFYAHGTRCEGAGFGGAITGIFEVTTTGEKISNSNIILVISFLVLGIILFIIGYSFEKQKYIIKSSLYLASLLFGILSISASKIIASDSVRLDLLGLSGLIVSIFLTLGLFLYVFITWTLQTFNILKQKEKLRWEY